MEKHFQDYGFGHFICLYSLSYLVSVFLKINILNFSFFKKKEYKLYFFLVFIFPFWLQFLLSYYLTKLHFKV